MASSFDQVGIFANNIQDTKAVFDVIAGQDEYDATSKNFVFKEKITSLTGLRIGVPKQYF